jgi:HAD superfamily hydrolase (TIGR01549 family)
MTRQANTSFSAVLFDLDDTLLYNDMEGVFLKQYFAMLAEYARPLAKPQALMAALAAASEAMQRHQDINGPTNEEKFASAFAPPLGKPWDELKAFFADFYEERFPELQALSHAHPDARRAVQACVDAGCQVVIATNPLFPARAIEHRIAWAGVDDAPFALITTYENMHTCKPYPAYYVEIAQQIGVSSQACLMVGNDVMRDIAPAREAGMATFLAERWVANPELNVTADRAGTLADLIAWITNGE